ncbi:SGNH/GDSL hydrolase family protein [Eubacterium sp. AB3007]|uniref:SGNH/GDSL hydrolase family protein n=1 Tax=Eubacterium sp. AB3007 TaxID=1392487 RepID=UPI000488C26C|nr:SGNH/GDSL hydrolase family protein [Eubacterium sp. AB3007]MBQ1471669.1 SGNH/GDSL hydrolase family protein [Eubacterium sp.]
MMNITVFGDSIARGIIYNERKSRYTISRDSFVERMRKRGIHLRNYSRMGFSSLRGKQTLDRHLAELCDADYTLLEYGGNDCDLNWQEISENPFALHKATVSLDRFRSVITSMIQTVRQAGSTPVLMTLPPLDSSRFFQWVSRDLDWESIYEFLDRDLDNIGTWHDNYSQVLTEVAADQHIPLIDVRSAFLEQDDYRELLCADGMHPNEKGHRLIEEQVAKTLIPTY